MKAFEAIHTMLITGIHIRHNRSHNKKTLDPNKGAWKDRVLSGLLEIHATAAPL